MNFDAVPEPNFDLLRRALLRQGELERVPMLELFADAEIIAAVLGVDYAPPADEVERTRWTQHIVEFWRRLGYGAVCIGPDSQLRYERVFTEDTAELPHNRRNWVAGDLGVIANWDDFERYPWPRAEDIDFTQIEVAARAMPEGMKLLSGAPGALEPVMWLMGYAPFAMALYDAPDLVQALFDRIAAIYIPVAEALLDMDAVGGLFVGDDMGFKTATMVAPEQLRQYVFPYHKRLAAMAHRRGKVYVLHACGNLEVVMDDLIDDVQIDAKHSFEDTIMPVEQVKARHGDRVGIVGGIDVDFLCRASEDEVRARTREVLDACMPGGGYVLGTGNSVANYVPVGNFLAMVDEGHRWRPS